MDLGGVQATSLPTMRGWEREDGAQEAPRIRQPGWRARGNLSQGGEGLRAWGFLNLQLTVASPEVMFRWEVSRSGSLEAEPGAGVLKQRLH